MRPAGALIVVLALLLAGCGEDAQQQRAREEAQASVRVSAEAARYDVDDAHCTNSARTGWFRVEKTQTFVCAVRLADGGCDWFRVDLGPGRTRVRLSDRDAGCVLPE